MLSNAKSYAFYRKKLSLPSNMRLVYKQLKGKKPLILCHMVEHFKKLCRLKVYFYKT